jgi:hypothetical protein
VGENFSDLASGLVCLISASSTSDPLYSSRAQIKGVNKLECPFRPPSAVLRSHPLFLSISNDGGITRSDNVVSQLPRLLRLVSPRLLFAGKSATLVLEGRSLDALGSPVKLLMSARALPNTE